MENLRNELRLCFHWLVFHTSTDEKGIFLPSIHYLQNTQVLKYETLDTRTSITSPSAVQLEFINVVPFSCNTETKLHHFLCFCIRIFTKVTINL